jgi:hypothetical protein
VHVSAVTADGWRWYGDRSYPPYERKTDRRGGSKAQLVAECRLLVVPLVLAGKSARRIRKLGQEKFGWSDSTAGRVTLVTQGGYNRQRLTRWRWAFQLVLTETLRRIGPSYFLPTHVRALSLRTPPRLDDKLIWRSGWDGPNGVGRVERGPPNWPDPVWDATQAARTYVIHAPDPSWDGTPEAAWQ